MQRIVDGVAYEGKVCPGAFDVRIWEQSGHREISARPVIEWTEIGPAGDGFIDGLGFPFGPREDTEQEIAERRERSLRKAAQRAQTACRRIIKAEGFNELLTITYRENQQDRALCKRHFEEWVRRMKRALGGEFRYCASFERQERGAMHVHVACHKLPKHAERKGVRVAGWRLGTEVWRSIVGADNGLVFVGGRKGDVRSRKALTRSAAKMAAYVSKYIMKDYAESPSGSNRYSRSNAIEVRKPVVVRMVAPMADVISAAFTCAEGDVVVSHRLGRWGDSWWLCTERDPAGSASPVH